MDDWHVGDPPDWGDSVGVPDIPYMGYINDDDDYDDQPPYIESNFFKARSLKNRALDLLKEGNCEEALSIINQALELDGREADTWNVKAIILEDMCRYEDALYYYDKALAIRDADVFRNNKASSLKEIAASRKYGGNYDEALRFVNEALKFANKDDMTHDCLYLKGEILEAMNREADSVICFYLAGKQFDKVGEFEKQIKYIKNTPNTLICIAGQKFYPDSPDLVRGVEVSLIKEPTNEHDKDAIRAEVNGQTVGYVANSDYTLFEGVKSASEIKSKIKDNQKARILFTYLDRHVVAKLI